jgi:hypothetical protein
LLTCSRTILPIAPPQLVEAPTGRVPAAARR